MTIRERLRAAWGAFREPKREYWRGFRAARAPLLEVLRRLDRRGGDVTLSKWLVMEMLWPNRPERERIERLLDAEHERELEGRLP